MTNRYLVKFHPSRTNDVIRAFLETFADWHRDISRDRFIGLSNSVWGYIFLTEGKTAQLLLREHPMQTTGAIDHTLPTFTDIAMLPLMDLGITEGKKHESQGINF